MKGLIRQILREQVDYSNFCLPIKRWSGTVNAGQKFGARRGSNPHRGIDLANDSGSNLYAPEDGTIKYAKFFTPWDNSLCPGCSRKDKIKANKDNGYNACGGYIQIKHTNNIVTKYCHLKQIDVSPGDPVVRGQVIGKTGGDSAANSPSGVDDKGRGNSSHSHLHYEVLVNGSWVNPDPDFVRNGECDGTVVVSTTLTGCTVGDCENGVGTYVWADGDKYVGDWVDGTLHGKGTFFYASGNKYVGDFVDGTGTGEGTFTVPGVYVYTGDHIGYYFTGKGTMVYADGGVYIGEWLEDDRHGQGKMTHADGTIEEGPWEEDVFVGISGQQDPTPDDPFTNKDREYNMSIQKDLQLRRFIAKGYTIEGIMDEETIEAIQTLQRAASLPTTGIFDKKTSIALSSNRYFGNK